MGAAIESVLSQSVSDLELLVVDDGSADGTAAHVRERYGEDGRLRVLEKENGGCGSARNAGVALARAPFVALLDSDDRALPGRLAAQLAAFERAPKASLCIGDARYEAPGGGPPDTMFAHRDFLAPLSLEAMFAGAWAIPSTWMLRTDVARRWPFDERVRYQEDTDFLFRFHRAGLSVVVVDEVLIVYRTEEPDRASDRMSDNRVEMDRYWTSIQERNWDALSPEDRAAIRRPVHVHRRLAQHYLRTGDAARAAPHCRAWWLGRPWRIRPLLRWIRASRAAAASREDSAR